MRRLGEDYITFETWLELHLEKYEDLDDIGEERIAYQLSYYEEEKAKFIKRKETFSNGIVDHFQTSLELFLGTVGEPGTEPYQQLLKSALERTERNFYFISLKQWMIIHNADINFDAIRKDYVTEKKNSDWVDLLVIYHLGEAYALERCLEMFVYVRDAQNCYLSNEVSNEDMLIEGLTAEEHIKIITNTLLAMKNAVEKSVDYLVFLTEFTNTVKLISTELKMEKIIEDKKDDTKK